MTFLFRHIDETFDINNCSNYILSIQCSLDGFYFCIYDSVVNKYVVLSGYELNTVTPFMLKNTIVSIIGSEPILLNHFRNVKVCYASPRITLMPSVFSEKNLHEGISDFIFEPERDEVLVIDKAGFGTSFVSGIPGIVKDALLDAYNNAVFFTVVSPFAVHDKNIGHSGCRVYINYHKHSLLILAVNGNAVLFFNMFYAKNAHDCIYYIMKVTKLIMADSKTAFILSGDFDKKSMVINMLKNYYTDVAFAAYSSRYAYSYTFYKEPEQKYVSLLDLAQCE